MSDSQSGGRRTPGARRSLGARSDFTGFRMSRELPSHLTDWRLPPEWRWGTEGAWGEHRHYQELVDALGRSLSLVSAPDPEHARWLEMEARQLAHRNHPSIATTYHYWSGAGDSGRGPGYLRRWIAGETVGARLGRQGPDAVPSMLPIVHAVGSVLAYLHDGGAPHGALSLDAVWLGPTGRTWVIGWQWVVPSHALPAGLTPDRRWMPTPPEWGSEWRPSFASDQWQLAALAFALLAGELPPSEDVPPLRLVQPETPANVAAVFERALHPDPERRHHSISAMLRALDRAVGARTVLVVDGDARAGGTDTLEGEEARLRWATGDDYEVLAALGSGMFGSVWRVRDLTLGREVALKMLHPHVARDDRVVARFLREARLAAQLQHPAIVPIYDWDSRADVAWYTMELAEGGSLADLIARSGPRSLGELAPQLESLLDGLAAAHSAGVVHRDLKPENILIDRYWHWRIADFGIANATGEDVVGSTGTPAFAAPEQLLGEPHGAAADCFAVAAIVMYALTGELPFGGGDGKAILARQLTGTLDLQDFPPEVASWLRHGLAPRPEDRYADATEMRDSWVIAMEHAMRRDRRLPWWRRLLAGEEGIPAS